MQPILLPQPLPHRLNEPLKHKTSQVLGIYSTGKSYTFFEEKTIMYN